MRRAREAEREKEIRQEAEQEKEAAETIEQRGELGRQRGKRR